MRFLVVSRTNTSPEIRALVAAGARVPSMDLTISDIVDDQIDLGQYDVVYWRSASLTHAYSSSAARSALFNRNREKTIWLNSGLFDQPDCVLKSVQQTRAYRTKSKLQIIPTYFAGTREIFEERIISKQLSFPIIAKPNKGSRGIGVYKLESIADFDEVPKPKSYVFQNFIPNDGDYRVMVVGGVAIDVVKRRPTEHSTKSYLNNVSQGGVAEIVPEGVLRQQLKKFAGEIAVTFSCQVVGVDFICNSETGALFFMEINTVPQWELFRPALIAPVGDAIVQLAQVLHERKTLRPINVVKSYFDTHIKTVPLDKQFHYFSRMALLLDDSEAWLSLQSLRTMWLPNREKLKQKIRRIPSVLAVEKNCSRAYRQSAHETHYKIALYNPVFFKLVFLQAIYRELVDDLMQSFDTDDIVQTYTAILADENALFTLSTQAINFMYHVQNFFPSLVTIPEPTFYLELTRRHVSDVSWSLGSQLYLLTHVIIGASQFYTRAIPAAENYLPLLKELERVIMQSYTSISLDQKCEFLLCAKLLKSESVLRPLVEKELTQSFSPLGNYFIDTYNTYSRATAPLRFSLAGSEHRNVLALATYYEGGE